MGKRILLGVAILLCCIGKSVAQNEVEGLRFSRTTHLGTARFAAMGGAFTALGGDLTTMAFNPAGIGVYRSDEFTLTGNLLYASTDVSYMGNSTNDYRYRFGLSNIGGVGVMNFGNEGLVSLNFGFAYNKTDNFGQRYVAQGRYQEYNTYMDYFAQVATNDGSTPDYLSDEPWMAYQAFLIDSTGVNGGRVVYSPRLADGDATQGRQSAEIQGYLSTYDFSMSTNISNVLYLGIGVGISSVKYFEDNTSSEYARPGNQSNFKQFDYTKQYRQTGVGYNFKFGAIAWPFANADFLNGLKIGAAIHTRTFLSMTDLYSADIVAQPRYGVPPPGVDNENQYGIETPTRIMGGLAYVFSPSASNDWRGILSVDYEYTDFSEIKLREESGWPANSPDDPHYNVSNLNIANGYKGTHNIRVGGELGYQNMSFRLGYARYDNPYTSSVDPYTGNSGKDGTINIFSGGAGVQVSKMFNINFAYSLSTQQDKQYTYYCIGNNGVNVISDEQKHTINQNNFFLTFGWRF